MSSGDVDWRLDLGRRLLFPNGCLERTEVLAGPLDLVAFAMGASDLDKE